MAEKISVQIGLEGGDQVEQQLTNIGVAGNQAFADLANAANRLAAATDKATAAQTGFSLATAKTTVEIAKYAAEIGLVGVEIVQTVRHHDTFIRSLIKLAGITNTTVKAVSLLTPELAAVGVAVGGAAAAVAGGVIAFGVIAEAATKYAASTEKLNHSLQMLAETSGQSFKSLQEGKAALAQLGIGGDRFEGIVTKINEAMSSLDIAAKFREGADAIEKASALTPEHFKALANNMGAVLPLVKKIEEGVKGLTFNELTTAQSKIDGVTASMKQAAAAGQNAGQVLLQFIVNADKASAIQVGKAFGITDEDVDRIRRLAASGVTVEEIFKRIQAGGVLISPASAAAFDAMRDSIAQVDSAWARLKQALDSTIFSTLAAQASTAFNDLKAAVFNFAAAFVEQLNQAGAAVSQVWQNTKREFETLGAALTSLGQALVKVFTDPLGALTDLLAGVQRLIDKFLVLVGLKSGAAPESGGGFKPWKMAGGGLLGGRGTGTSDSNLAWLSRGEYVTPARAVAQPGVLGFLEALRRSGGNLSRVLDGMGRFALGGMVPRFAAGGLAGGSNVTIQFPGLPAIGGLRASADVVDQLHRAAALAQVRSGGRKPSRYS